MLTRIPRSKSGFTLIELLVVIGVTGILLVLISSIFTNIVSDNINSTVSNDLRENGQFMMETMARAVREADTVSVDCASPCTSNVIYLDNSGVVTTFNFDCHNLYKYNLYKLSSPSGYVADYTTGPKSSDKLNNNNTTFGSNNTIDVYSSSNCNSVSPNIPSGASNFFVTIGSGINPTTVKINLTLKAAGPGGFARAFLSSQTFSETVTQRHYNK